MIGTSLSHYRITEKLGQGGMGEVYRAEDTNLSRQVAIKVLPDEFAHDAERLARFEREAKLLASLNHPNIAAIHGLEEHEGKRFLVLELVEGQTLADRIKKGHIPLDETLDLCRQIAEGLEAAHEKGIIHRDLKPANVKVTPEGKVKILDFGLAKAFQGEPTAPDVSKSPTLTSQMTHAGVILGTAAYMSPEQARGKAVDKRADIWAFGCVLYECLTGKRAFEGETVTETMASILKSEPDWALLPAETFPSVRSVLRRCLQKDTSLRIHDIADVRVEIQEKDIGSAAVVPASRPISRRTIMSAAAAALLIGILVGAALMQYFRPLGTPASQTVVRSNIELESGYWLDGMRFSPPYGLDHPTRTALAISRDARFLVYSAVKQNPGAHDRPHLYMCRLDQLAAAPIPGTEGGISPFLSPDERWLGFWADGKLQKVPLAGGVPVILCDAPGLFGATWGPDNSILFASLAEGGISRVSGDGGEPEALTKPDLARGEASHRLPHALPGGRNVLFTIMTDPWDPKPRIGVLRLEKRDWSVLLDNATDARYVHTGHLVFMRRGILMAVPFDAEELRITGQPVPAIDRVMHAVNTTSMRLETTAGQLDISDSGDLIYAPGGITPSNEASLVWVDRGGLAQAVVTSKSDFEVPRISPDGQKLLYYTATPAQRVWILDIQRGIATPLTSEGRANEAVWTPDGARVVFNMAVAGGFNLFWQPADGSLPVERLTTSTCQQWPGSWSEEGKILAILEKCRDDTDVSILRMSDRQVTPLLNSRFDESCAEFSPDGHWLAYTSDESGREEVYVRAFPGSGGRRQISNEGGSEPLWARSGRELFYRQGSQVWAVDIESGPGLSTGKPHLLFEQSGYASWGAVRDWDVSPDGKRFLMVRLEERKSEPVTEMILVQNWLEELKRLVPVK